MTGWSLIFSPLLPQNILLLLAVVLVAVTVLGVINRQRSAIWRLTAGLSLLLTLSNPNLQRELRDTLPGVALIVADDSVSQTIGQRREQTEKTIAALQAQLQALPNMSVRTVHAGGNVTPDTEGTSLFGPLLQNLADIPADRIAGVFIVTDGQVHDIPEEAAALPFHAPVHALITGEKNEHDRRIVIVDSPRFAVLNTQPKIRFRVEDEKAAGDQADVEIRLNGTVVGTTSVRIGDAVDQSVEIKTAGENVVELSVAGTPDELTALNNRAAVSIKGMRENLRVLLISGEPYAGERTWRNLLKSDAAVDLVHFTILRPPDKVDSTPIRELSLIAFPVRELFQEKIGDFDLIIFDRYERRNILPMVYFDNMADYVRHGGAILVVSGPEDAGVDSVYQTALNEVLPAEPTGALTEKAFLPQLSDVGLRHPVTRNLPGSGFETPHWSHWFRAINASVREGKTLMTGPDKTPLLVLSQAGEGRVATLLSDQVWLWARNFEGGGPHTDLLRRVVHWLMKEPELDEESLHARQDGANIIIERQSMEQGGTAVQVQRPDGAVESLRLSEQQAGLWRGASAASLPGLYRITQGDKSAQIAVGPPNPREFTDVRSTTEKIGALSEATGGTARRLSENGTLSVPKIRLVNADDKAYGPGWLGLYQRNVTDLKGVETFPLLQGLLGLTLALGLAAFSWYREGR